MSDTATRSLTLLATLQRHGLVSADTLAADLGVTTRTVRRDVARLRDLGYPVDTRLGVDGGYSLELGAVLPPVFLSAEEASACTLALRRWDEGADGPALAALRKVVASMPRRLQQVTAALEQSTLTVPLDGLAQHDPAPVDVGVLGELARSCVLRQQVEIDHAGRDGRRTTRAVEPSVLVSTVRRWYLVAFDLAAQAWRTYRVDRVTGVTATGTPAVTRPAPGPSIEEWVTDQVRAGWQRVTATVRVHAPVEVVRRWVAPAWGSVEAEPAGTTIVRAGADSYDAIARWLLLVQADVDVVEPTGLREAFGRAAAQAARSAALVVQVEP